MPVTKWELWKLFINIFVSNDMDVSLWLIDSHMNSLSATNSLRRFCRLRSVFALAKQKCLYHVLWAACKPISDKKRLFVKAAVFFLNSLPRLRACSLFIRCSKFFLAREPHSLSVSSYIWTAGCCLLELFETFGLALQWWEKSISGEEFWCPMQESMRICPKTSQLMWTARALPLAGHKFWSL